MRRPPSGSPRRGARPPAPRDLKMRDVRETQRSCASSKPALLLAGLAAGVGGCARPPKAPSMACRPSASSSTRPTSSISNGSIRTRRRAAASSTIGTAARTSFDSFNSFILKGDAAQGLELPVRLADGARATTSPMPSTASSPTRPRWRPTAARSRSGCGPRPSSPTARALTADDVVFTLQHPQGEGPSALSRAAQGRDARPRRSIAHTVRYTFTGTADARPAAGGGRPADPVQGLLRHARVRSDHARAAAGLRPLQDRRLQAGRVRQLQAPRRLLGQGPARQPRPLQLRRAALRVLSRPHGRARELQGRRLRSARGVHRARLGHGLRHPRRQGRPAASSSRCPTRAPPARRASSSTRAGPSSPTCACARRSTTPSTSSGPTRTSSTASTRAPRASSRTRT